MIKHLLLLLVWLFRPHLEKRITAQSLLLKARAQRLALWNEWIPPGTTRRGYLTPCEAYMQIAPPLKHEHLQLLLRAPSTPFSLPRPRFKKA